MSTSPIIEITDLTKIYGEHSAQSVTALSDVSLTVRDGEFLSIVGPSGCGKTTLLKIIAGLVEKTNGSVQVQGKEVTKPQRSIGVVFQDSSLFPWRSVLRNAEFGLEIMGVEKAERRETVMEMLSLVGLSGFEDAYPDELSGGMKQRVSLARTLATDPDILLMDEPFGALDEQTRLFMGEELLRIWKETGKTIVLITHSLQESVHLSDRVSIMSNRPGRIKHVETIEIPRPRESDVIGMPEFSKAQSRIWDIVKEESSITLETQ